jgi:hypothetical protein
VLHFLVCAVELLSLKTLDVFCNFVGFIEIDEMTQCGRLFTHTTGTKVIKKIKIKTTLHLSCSAANYAPFTISEFIHSMSTEPECTVCFDTVEPFPIACQRICTLCLKLGRYVEDQVTIDTVDANHPEGPGIRCTGSVAGNRPCPQHLTGATIYAVQANAQNPSLQRFYQAYMHRVAICLEERASRAVAARAAVARAIDISRIVHAIDTTLTLCCPVCQAAVADDADPEECRAMTCPRTHLANKDSPAYICGLCFAVETSNEAIHNHVNVAHGLLYRTNEEMSKFRGNIRAYQCAYLFHCIATQTDPVQFATDSRKHFISLLSADTADSRIRTTVLNYGVLPGRVQRLLQMPMSQVILQASSLRHFRNYGEAHMRARVMPNQITAEAVDAANFGFQVIDNHDDDEHDEQQQVNGNEVGYAVNVMFKIAIGAAAAYVYCTYSGGGGGGGGQQGGGEKGEVAGHGGNNNGHEGGGNDFNPNCSVLSIARQLLANILMNGHGSVSKEVTREAQSKRLQNLRFHQFPKLHLLLWANRQLKRSATFSVAMYQTLVAELFPRLHSLNLSRA